MEAELTGKPYQRIFESPYRWEDWAAPKTADGSFDHNNAMTGDDLVEFVDDQLFPYLQGFKQKAELDYFTAFFRAKLRAHFLQGADEFPILRRGKCVGIRYFPFLPQNIGLPEYK